MRNINRNYQTPTVAPGWAERRETHPAVAMAIHAIADDRRSAEAIWEDPTKAEWDHVAMAVEEYINNDLYPEEDLYWWGQVAIIGHSDQPWCRD